MELIGIMCIEADHCVCRLEVQLLSLARSSGGASAITMHIRTCASSGEAGVIQSSVETSMSIQRPWIVIACRNLSVTTNHIDPTVLSPHNKTTELAGHLRPHTVALYSGATIPSSGSLGIVSLSKPSTHSPVAPDPSTSKESIKSEDAYHTKRIRTSLSPIGPRSHRPRQTIWST